MRTPIVMSILCAAAFSAADSGSTLPNPDTRFREGANHHTGDDGFMAAFGHQPGAKDSEKLRMKAHFQAVRNWLAARPATKPALEKRRAEILGYLDAYIAKGTTPINDHLPWRVPVFIDDDHTICAVGYLIEQSAGRALPEKIAKEHRYEYIDDIAKEMPDVAAWVAESGFTLDELSHVQPAYASPTVETWRTWDLARHAPNDGPYKEDLHGIGGDRTVAGTFDRKSLDGTWTVTKHDKIVGTGTLAHGNGTWKSYYKDGTHLLASGPYRNNKADGEWTFFHVSGNVAAKGKLVAGMRSGAWTFYYDTAAKTPIIKGQFTRTGWDTGVWQHFDAAGKPLAKTYSEGGDVIDMTRDANGVRLLVHTLTQGTQVDVISHRLDRLVLGNERIFVHDSAYAKTDMIYDAAGFRLEHTATGWTAADCHWPAKRKAIAKGDNVAWLHALLVKDSKARDTTKISDYETDDIGPQCGPAQPVAAVRGARLDTMMATRTTVRAPTPAFVRTLVLNAQEDADGDDAAKADDEPAAPAADETTGALAMPYLQWAHVDSRFDQVFATMAGRIKWEWFESELEADGSSPNDRKDSQKAR